MRILAVLIAAGALVACVPKPQATSAPLEVETATSDAPAPATPEPRVMSERCEAWIAWLADGNRGNVIVPVARAALEHIAKDCLGRYGNAYEPSPIPPPPDKPPEIEAPTPEQQPEPEPALSNGEKIAI